MINVFVLVLTRAWQYVKRNLLPRFYGIYHACAINGAQTVFPPRKKWPGNEVSVAVAYLKAHFIFKGSHLAVRP